mmetsp:Transcript_4526/g.28756  ORF Transcript_4526/g.28756 Transcript_4526/m.28756 type:complete len:485 (-) Transcript_4526:2334-3788(-)
MAQFVRRVVSQTRRRTQEDGFDLDLTYITPTLVAMAFPGTGTTALYRNRAKDVRKFLEQRHGSRYRVINLCAEKHYDSSVFGGRVDSYPIMDHNVPSLELMVDFCERAYTWQNTHEQNVLVLHCKAGKGRTGIMLCAYLIYTGRCSSVEEAVRMYNQTRTMDGDGLTIPSQLRYLYHFSNQCQVSRLLDDYLSIPVAQKVEKLEIQLELPGVEEITVALYNRDNAYAPSPKLVAMCTTSPHKRLHSFGHGRIKIVEDRVEVVFELEQGTYLQGDLKVQVFDGNQSGKGSLFWFWLHTSFLKSDEILFTKSALDKVSKKYSNAQINVSARFQYVEDDASKHLQDGTESMNAESYCEQGDYSKIEINRASCEDMPAMEETIRTAQNAVGRNVMDSDLSQSCMLAQGCRPQVRSISTCTDKVVPHEHCACTIVQDRDQSIQVKELAIAQNCIAKLELAYFGYRQQREANLEALESIWASSQQVEQVV